MATGMPVAICFILINLIGRFFFFGGLAGLEHFSTSIFDSVTSFVLLPIPLFILMGEVMFQSGIASPMMDALDKWLGRLPGRLGLQAVAGGAILSTLTGMDLATTAIMGDALVPEMEKRGYKKAMTMGPILGSGGLAIMIPPSDLAVLLGALGKISIGKLLMAIIFPGILMGALYATYIIVRSILQPAIAPAYGVTHFSLSDKLLATARYILPIGFVIFAVVGLILFGIATPTEAAATGAISMFLLSAAYGRLNWQVAKKSLMGTLHITGMIMLILAGAVAFSQILAFSGASRGLIGFATTLPLSPIFILIAMLVIILFLGAFMEPVSIMMVTLPLFMPIVNNLGFDPVWFGVIYLLSITMGEISPPFGLCLFVMKGVAPPDTTIGDVYRAGLPFLGLDLIAIVLLIAFPQISLWLPGVMR